MGYLILACFSVFLLFAAGVTSHDVTSTAIVAADSAAQQQAAETNYQTDDINCRHRRKAEPEKKQQKQRRWNTVNNQRTGSITPESWIRMSFHTGPFSSNSRRCGADMTSSSSLRSIRPATHSSQAWSAIRRFSTRIMLSICCPQCV